VPRVIVGEEYLEGNPTKAEIVAFYIKIHPQEDDGPDIPTGLRPPAHETISSDMAKE
jgi:hypothetical protein